MSDNQLHEFIAAQHQLNLTMAGGLARIEQAQKDTNTRLFGGDGQKGLLPYMIESAATAAKEEGERISKLTERTTALESWRMGTNKWVGGVVAVLTLEGTALRLYFNSVSHHLQNLGKVLTK